MNGPRIAPDAETWRTDMNTAADALDALARRLPRSLSVQVLVDVARIRRTVESLSDDAVARRVVSAVTAAAMLRELATDLARVAVDGQPLTARPVTVPEPPTRRTT